MIFYMKVKDNRYLCLMNSSKYDLFNFLADCNSKLPVLFLLHKQGWNWQHKHFHHLMQLINLKTF